MATTTNYGWTTPDDTGLVKDGASNIRTLGSSIDTTTKALNPSTTLGDIEYRSSTANTNTRLGIGSTGNVLTVSGGVPTWAAPASGGGMTLIETLSLTGSAVTSSTIAGTYTDLQIIIRDSYSNNGSAYSMRINGDTGSNYFHYSIRNDAGTVSGPAPTTGTDIALNGATATSTGYKNVYYGEISIPRYSSSNYKSIFHTSYMGAYPGFYLRYALWDNTAAITSITIKCDGGTFSAGNAYIYGVK